MTKTYRCPGCGQNEFDEISKGKYKCRHCDEVHEFGLNEADSNYVYRNTEKALLAQTMNNIEKILYNLDEKAHETYINDKEIVHWCRELRKYIPDHFMAKFYETAVGNDRRALAEFVGDIDAEAHSEQIDEVLRFAIKLIAPETALALNNLIIRAYENKNIELYAKWNKVLQAETQRVDASVYDVDLPRDVFVAYKSEDMRAVEALVDILENEEGLMCFVAARNLQHGRMSDYDEKLEKAMDNCKAVVFVSSKMSRKTGDARNKELPHIIKRDMERAPAEYTARNEYIKLPKKYKKPRVEYVIEAYGNVTAEYYIKTFFDGYERVCKPDAKAVAKSLYEQFDAPIAEEKTPSLRTKSTVKYCAKCGEENPIKAIRCCICGNTEFAETKEQYIELSVRKKLEAEYAAKLEVERAALAQQKQEAEHRAKQAEEAAARQKQEAEHRAKQAEEAAARQKQEAEHRAKQAEEAAARQKQEAEHRAKQTVIAAEQAAKAKSERRPSIYLSDFEIRNGVLKEYKGEGVDVVISDSVTSIREFAFSGCRSLTSITIPNRVTSIGGYAFSGCSSLTSITIPNSVTSIGRCAFCDCSSLTGITVESGNTKYYSVGNCIIERDSKTIVVGCKNSVIPNSVTSIGEKAFDGCSSLTSITIPDSVTSIGYSAFSGCSSLTSITIPDSVTSIGYSAFSGCSSLTSITIPNSVTSIGNSAFA